MGLLDRLLGKKVFLYRGMTLTDSELQRIRSSGIENETFRTDRTRFERYLQEDADKYLRGRGKIIVDKHGLRQVPEISNHPIGNGWFGIHLTSDINEAFAYSGPEMGVSRKNAKSYVFEIEVKPSQIHEGKGPAGPKHLVHRVGSHYIWLDMKIPMKFVSRVVERKDGAPVGI